MLNVSELNQFYNESHTLWDVHLTIAKGSCMCLMGRNGVGKTTLLNTIMGILPLTSGKIEFNGELLNQKPPEVRAKSGIGYVPQGRDIFSQLTVEENLRIGLLARSDGLKEIPKYIFELFPVLKEMLGRRGGDLSGGQQQQLAIGRALAINPKLLILDEPTEGIQPNIVHEIGDIIIKLNQEREVTVLLVEQKLPFVRRVSKQFSILDKGRNVASGNMEDLDDALVDQYLTV
tara:strand:- start:3496 stop:4191 length:696 start_codon:yes stop_codon:yes gene_type:complete